MPAAGASVLQYHKSGTRDGVYVDAAITQAAAAKMHLDPGFSAAVDGEVYAQPLFVDGGPGGKDMLIVATEKNQVYALDPMTGAILWNKKLGNETPVSLLQCGQIDPFGVTGTPVIDLPSRTMFLDAVTAPGGSVVQHLVFAMSIDNGAIEPGWPVDVDAKVQTAGATFDSTDQGERGSLAIMGDKVYVPFGGLDGDCGSYHGWVAGIAMKDPTNVTSWATDAAGGGIWAPGGLATDGTRIFAATGNTFAGASWQGGEAVIAFTAGPAFSGQNADYWAPPNWKYLDDNDIDLGGSGPVLFDAPGASPSHLVAALGKDGNVYIMDRSNLGGIAAAIDTLAASTGEIINSATAYTTGQGTFIAFKGNCPSGNLAAVQVSATSPPKLSSVWCADQMGNGSPMTTTTDGTHETVVWAMGAEGDDRLHGFDGSTGQVVFDGGGPNDQMSGVRRFATPIAAKGRIYAAGTGAVFAFTSN
jgi:hypothetical protein